eukprot:TRINITY_DN8862_c0_g1_i1.p1 TRINITY_DN8862_c0_g1~~TRINITY_DN8862_c0_g1_i1.p1  ORF type:complete len:324 (+),score=42.73 TRINITY_DN8862_c0_g1_i1:114-1085(+)
MNASSSSSALPYVDEYARASSRTSMVVLIVSFGVGFIVALIRAVAFCSPASRAKAKEKASRRNQQDSMRYEGVTCCSVAPSPSCAFHALMLIFFLFRIIWMCLILDSTFKPESDYYHFIPSTFFLSKSAHFLLYSALSMVVIHRLVLLLNLAQKKRKYLLVGTILILSIPLIYIVSFTIILIGNPNLGHEGNTMYELTIIFILAYGILSTGCLGSFLAILSCRIKSLKENSLFFKVDTRSLVQMLILLGMCLGFLIEQFIFFLYRPITGKKMSLWAFYILAYLLPEGTISSILMWSMRKTLVKVNVSREGTLLLENEASLNQS